MPRRLRWDAKYCTLFACRSLTLRGDFEHVVARNGERGLERQDRPRKSMILEGRTGIVKRTRIR